MTSTLATTLTTEHLRGFGALVAGPLGGAGAEELTTELSELETLKHAIEAREARLALEVDRAMRESAAARGVPAARQSRSVAETVAAARRISPAQGRAVVTMAKQLRTMPSVFARFAAGDLSEHKATLIAREAAVLDPADQRRLDAEVSLIGGLKEMGTRKLAHRVQTIALALDEDAVVRRRERAVEDRHVTIRPTDRGDGMAVLTALLPVEQAAAIKEALDRAADVAVTSGCATSRSQVRADTLAARLLGEAGGGPTTAANAQGLCRQCNWAKQVIGNQDSQPPPLITPIAASRRQHHLVVDYRADLSLAA